MEGYIKNVSSGWTHAFKRSVKPGAKISFDELYDQYGKKHDLSEGKEFVDWLKNVKLKNATNRWAIVEKLAVKDIIDELPTEDKGISKKTDKNVSPKNMDVSEVVELSFRKAKEVLPRISDIKLLKYALQEARPRAGKDSLCRLLYKRIAELETIAR